MNSYSYTVKNFEAAEISTEKQIVIDKSTTVAYTNLLPNPSKVIPQKNNDDFDEIGCEIGEYFLGMTKYWNQFRFLDMQSQIVISSDLMRLSLQNIKMIDEKIELSDEDERKEFECDEDF